MLGHAVALQEVAGSLDENMPNVERESRKGATSLVAKPRPRQRHLVLRLVPSCTICRYCEQELKKGCITLSGGGCSGAGPLRRQDLTGRHFTSAFQSNLSCVLNMFSKDNLAVLNVYERPTCERLDTHKYVIDVAGHVLTHPALAALADIDGFRILGSSHVAIS
ncbi:hypothetical protein A9K65_030680 [Mesorhizobium sp. WSM1497]|nr:hypothetical protein A9K65_030680 [Mesorhizobium sp. WSM1497]